MKPQNLDPILLLIACLTLSPMAQAGNPPMDNPSSFSNTAYGDHALEHNNGFFDSAFGASALEFNTNGNYDTASGAFALRNIPVRIDFGGRLDTQTSSRRFKDHIAPMDEASETILALRPVTFHYKDDSKCRPEFGLIAEEVAKVDPNLVALDKEGKPYTVRYDQVNAMLLNEFLKEHRKVQQQEATIAQLQLAARDQQKNFASNLAKQQKQIETLASSLQGVKTELEVTKRPVRVLANNP